MVLPDRIELSTSPLPMECSGFGNIPSSQSLSLISKLGLCQFCAS
jgi:hypothetical protein